MFQRMKKSRKGFSLVELVVVILIIAILAAAIFLGGATVIRQARESQVKSDLNNMATYVQDMLYENPDLQYFKGTMTTGNNGYGTQESYTFDATTDKFAGASDAESAANFASALTDFTTLPVLAKLNADYMTADFQLGDMTRDAWDAPYLWSYDMSPATGANGDTASCIIVINSMGINSQDETSDAAAKEAVKVADTVVDRLGAATDGLWSATEVVEDAAIKGMTSDDYGVVIVMIDGQVSVDYYGF